MFLALSGILVMVSIAAMAVFGFRQGIDFAGGTLWEISGATLDKAGLQEIIPDAVVAESANGLSIRLRDLSEDEHQSLLKKIQDKFIEVKEERFESIGPAIGREIRANAVWAFVMVLAGISLYIAFAFRKVSYPVSSWKYGLITLVTLFHDALIPAGMFAVMGEYGVAEINTNFIIAILVVMGFSVHDTIVVFDRIRENIRLNLIKNESFDGLVGRSISETMARSINTSLTLVLVLIALFFLASATLNYFVLVILVGTIFGTYSSICIASPLLTLWRRNDKIVDGN